MRNPVARISAMFRLPLLGKELAEQAARRRTYIVRLIYVLLLLLGFSLFYSQQMRYRGQDVLAMLGSGRALFGMLIGLQFAGIYLFLPAMMSGVIVAEKERDSLGLLIITGLTPWQILAQKFMGRIIPMFNFLLLSLPLMAVAYGFGGISSDYFWASILVLVLACLQTGAFALMISCLAQGTATAFIATYLLGVLFFMVLPMMHGMRFVRLSIDIGLAVFPPYIFGCSCAQGVMYALYRSIPIMLSTLVFFGVARWAFLRRAFVRNPQSLLLRVFRRLDRVMKTWNRYAGNVTLIRDRGELPEKDPIAWRETHKFALGKVHYLFRLFVAVELPVALIITFMLYGGAYRVKEWLIMTTIFLWVISALILTVVGAGAISRERTRQTLDVLLTLPLDGRKIIMQKLRGIRRLMLVLAVPILTVMVAEAWWGWWRTYYWSVSYDYTIRTFIYVAVSLLCVCIYMPMLVWLALWISFKVRSRSRAIITAVVAVVAWVLVPIIVVILLHTVFRTFNTDVMNYAALASPGFILAMNESGEIVRAFRETGVLLPIILNFAFYITMLWVFRSQCLKHADKYLGRM